MRLPLARQFIQLCHGRVRFYRRQHYGVQGTTLSRSISYPIIRFLPCVSIAIVLAVVSRSYFDEAFLLPKRCCLVHSPGRYGWRRERSERAAELATLRVRAVKSAAVAERGSHPL